jgi:hypothetical protein
MWTVVVELVFLEIKLQQFMSYAKLTLQHPCILKSNESSEWKYLNKLIINLTIPDSSDKPQQWFNDPHPLTIHIRLHWSQHSETKSVSYITTKCTLEFALGLASRISSKLTARKPPKILYNWTRVWINCAKYGESVSAWVVCKSSFIFAAVLIAAHVFRKRQIKLPRITSYDIKPKSGFFTMQ